MKINKGSANYIPRSYKLALTQQTVLRSIRNHFDNVEKGVMLNG